MNQKVKLTNETSFKKNFRLAGLWSDDSKECEAWNLKTEARLIIVIETLAQKLLRLARLRHFEKLRRINHTHL